MRIYQIPSTEQADIVTTQPPFVIPPRNAPAWPSIAGIDSELAANLMGGDVKFFRQMLMMFAESNRDTLAQLKARLAADDREQAARLAHQLKGVSANIAAMALSQAARDLEQAILQRTQDLDPLFDRVADELATILG